MPFQVCFHSPLISVVITCVDIEQYVEVGNGNFIIIRKQIDITLNTHVSTEAIKSFRRTMRAEHTLRLHSPEWLAAQSKLLIKIKQTKSSMH